jgi:hypothetical protein
LHSTQPHTVITQSLALSRAIRATHFFGKLKLDGPALSRKMKDRAMTAVDYSLKETILAFRLNSTNGSALSPANLRRDGSS